MCYCGHTLCLTLRYIYKHVDVYICWPVYTLKLKTRWNSQQCVNVKSIKSKTSIICGIHKWTRWILFRIRWIFVTVAYIDWEWNTIPSPTPLNTPVHAPLRFGASSACTTHALSAQHTLMILSIIHQAFGRPCHKLFGFNTERLY